MPGPEPIPGLHGPDKRPQRTDGGDFVRRVRLALGMTQASFAKVLRVTRWQVLRWEQGAAKPNPRAHKDIQKLLETPLARAKLQADSVYPFNHDGQGQDS